MADEYISKIKETVSTYRDWYNVFIPQIELSVVESELLTLSEVTENFGITEKDINHYLEKNLIVSYEIQERKIVRRPEIENLFTVKTNDKPSSNN